MVNITNIAVLGHGVVGSGVVEVLKTNASSIESKAGHTIEVKKILDLRDFPDLDYSDKFTKDFNEILNDDDITIVFEGMGGVNPAFDFVEKSLIAKKSVVTSNKELVAAKGAYLLKLAKENNVNFFFEASVGGGIPIIRPMHHCLAANNINEIAGILNGTTNFILTKMVRDKTSFADALSEAQALGYAERDPSADVDGIDVSRKISILSSLAFGKHVYPDNVYTKGIRDITLIDIEYANDFSCTVKLIGRAKKVGDMIECYVSPSFVSLDSQLSGINDVYNGVLVKGDATGDVVFYGKGAGKLPTASAVVADIIDAAKSTSTSKSLHWEDCTQNIVIDYNEYINQYYVRMTSDDTLALIDQVKSNFTQAKFLDRDQKPENEIAFVTNSISFKKLNIILDNIKMQNHTVITYLPIANNI